MEAESSTKQKIALIDKEVELQKLLEHLKAKCSAFHQVLEQELSAFDKADESQKTAIRTNKRAIVAIYSQLLKNKEELKNAKVVGFPLQTEIYFSDFSNEFCAKPTKNTIRFVIIISNYQLGLRYNI